MLVIYLEEKYIPGAIETGEARNPRLTRILSHESKESECFALQMEFENMDVFRKWYQTTATALNADLVKVFDKKVVGFPTLMETVDIITLP